MECNACTATLWRDSVPGKMVQHFCPYDDLSSVPSAALAPRLIPLSSYSNDPYAMKAEQHSQPGSPSFQPSLRLWESGSMLSWNLHTEPHTAAGSVLTKISFLQDQAGLLTSSCCASRDEVDLELVKQFRNAIHSVNVEDYLKDCKS